MTQVTVSVVPQCTSPPKGKRNSFLSSGRGGSGNIRRPQAPTNGDVPPVASLQDRAADKRPERSGPPAEPHRSEQRCFMSSGRGGSGNIQLSELASDLEAHPLAASILNHHNAVEAQHEQHIRKVHAESSCVHSSGRGGSGNMLDVRRRSRSQGPSTTSRKRLFTTKGRERGAKDSDSVIQGHDGEGRNVHKRTSHATYSSGGSSTLDTRYCHEGSVAVTSTNPVTPDCLPCEGVTSTGPGHSGKKRSLMACWSKASSSRSSVASPGSPHPLAPSPTPATHSRSVHTSSPVSGSQVYSPTSVMLEGPEYVSFLEL